MSVHATSRKIKYKNIEKMVNISGLYFIITHTDRTYTICDNKPPMINLSGQFFIIFMHSFHYILPSRWCYFLISFFIMLIAIWCS